MKKFMQKVANAFKKVGNSIKNGFNRIRNHKWNKMFWYYFLTGAVSLCIFLMIIDFSIDLFALLAIDAFGILMISDYFYTKEENKALDKEHQHYKADKEKIKRLEKENDRLQSKLMKIESERLYRFYKEEGWDDYYGF